MRVARTIKDTSSWTEPRTLENLPAFLKQQCGKLAPTPAKPMGAPHTLVVTASGIRAADVFRSLKAGLPKAGIKNPTVTKLFAKHMKVVEQVEHLKKNKWATPFGSCFVANLVELTLGLVRRSGCLRY